MSVLHLKAEDFKSQVLESNVPVLVDFYADWCGPCKMIAPIIEELSVEYAEKAKVCKLNVDVAQSIAVEYSVMSIPTLIVFKDGKIAEQVMGALPKAQIASMLDKYL